MKRFGPFPRALLVLTIVGIVLVLLYRGIDFGYSVIHPTYRHVRTTEIAWPADPTFNNCWNDPTERYMGAVDWPMSRGGPGICQADGTMMPVNGNPDMVLSVEIPRRVLRGSPAMQLRRSEEHTSE